MADPTPPASPQPTSPAKPKAPGDELDGGPLDLLKQNAATMVAILVAVVALAVLVSYRSGQSHAFGLKAWEKLAELNKQQPTVVDGFAEATRTYDGTDAEPYIQVSWASRLYESGEKPKVERALQLYEQVLKEHPQHSLFKDVLPEQIERIKAELNSPRSHLVTVPAGGAPPAGGPTPEAPGGAAPPN